MGKTFNEHRWFEMSFCEKRRAMAFSAAQLMIMTFVAIKSMANICLIGDNCDVPDHAPSFFVRVRLLARQDDSLMCEQAYAWKLERCCFIVYGLWAYSCAACIPVMSVLMDPA